MEDKKMDLEQEAFELIEKDDDDLTEVEENFLNALDGWCEIVDDEEVVN